MKARIIGAQTQMESFKFYFGCQLGRTLLSQTDNLSQALQNPSYSAMDAKRLAIATTAVLEQQRTDEEFDQF